MLSLFRDYLKHRQVYQTIRCSGLFDRDYYLRNNLDVARSGFGPVKHYLNTGWREGRNPNRYFDTAWYLQTHLDAAESGLNPLYHYLLIGWKQRCDPSPRFSIKDYLVANPDLMNADVEPLHHFLQSQKAVVPIIDFCKLKSESSRVDGFGKVAIHAHIYHTDLTNEFIDYINHVPGEFDCFITTDKEAKRKTIHEIVDHHLMAQKVEIRIAPNIGRDIAPFVVACRDIITDYDYVCHVHTKKSLHDNFGNDWREYLLDHLLGSQRQVKAILNCFLDQPDVGLLYPVDFMPTEKRLELDFNKWNVEKLAKRIGLQTDLPQEIVFPAGSMFWVKTKAFQKLLDAELGHDEFEDEAGQLDGTLAHAFERLFVYIARESGYSSRRIALKTEGGHSA